MIIGHKLSHPENKPFQDIQEGDNLQVGMQGD